MSRKPKDPVAEASQDLGPAVRLIHADVSDPAGENLLCDLDFSIETGSVHFLTGPQGAGKTALLNLIGGTGRPSRGSLQVLGADLCRLPERQKPALRQRIGRIFQDLRLLDHLSAFDNAALAPRLSGRSVANYRAEVAELLTWVGLGQRMGVAAGALSDLDRRRLAVARAVAGRPALILADEPAGKLQPAGQVAILRLLANLGQAGMTMLIATRDETTAARSGAATLHIKGKALIRYAAAAREVAP